MDRRRLNMLLRGLAAGDGFGSTSEFVPQKDMPALHERLKHRGWPFRQVGGGYFNWKPGEPTDDTAMALCLVRSFREFGRFDGADVARRWVEWLDSNPPDVGFATRRGLETIRRGTPWYEGGLAHYQQNRHAAANGSLMRNGVVAAMADPVEEALRISLHQGLSTHYAPLPVICCCAQTWLIHELLARRRPFRENWMAQFESRFMTWLGKSEDSIVQSWERETWQHTEEAMEMFREADLGPDSFNPFGHDYDASEGYCLLTLQIAVWAAQWSLRNKPFPTPPGFPDEVFARTGPYVLGWVAMIGHDADTYGAAAGPLVAAAWGGVPPELTEGLHVLRELKEPRPEGCL